MKVGAFVALFGALANLLFAIWEHDGGEVWAWLSATLGWFVVAMEVKP